MVIAQSKLYYEMIGSDGGSIKVIAIATTIAHII